MSNIFNLCELLRRHKIEYWDCCNITYINDQVNTCISCKQDNNDKPIYHKKPADIIADIYKELNQNNTLSNTTTKKRPYFCTLTK